MRPTSIMNNFFHNDALSPFSPKNSQELVQQQHQFHQLQAHSQVRRSQGTNSPYSRQRQVEGALAYLSEVKSAFTSQPCVYDEFLDIMREFKALRIDTAAIIHKVSALFRDHPRLIFGFNSFLPPGYNIELPSDHSVSSPSQPPPSPLCQHLRASSPVRKLQQNLDEKCNETVSPTSEMHFNSNELHTSSSERPLNSTADVSEKMELEPISSEVQNAAQALYDNQPVEYSEATKFVNKIKGRFHDNPGIYKQFLQILNTYQEEQKKVKEGACLKNDVLSEAEVYTKVEELFDEQTDLLDEFGKFLPSSSGNTASAVNNGNKKCSNSNGINHSASFHLQTCNKPLSKSLHSGKRLTYWSPELPKKKARAREKNISYSEAGKIGSLTEYGFFDKVRKALRTPEVYHNFLRCLVLYNKEVVSREELVELVKPFLGKFPELLKEFKTMLSFKDSGTNVELIPNKVAYQARKKVSPELEMEIDYSSCRKCGASYRALPSSYIQPKCSGRTSLCKEVLNDTWVSFPSWSEDSTFVSSRKTQYEEYIYRCEDERFELDVVLETNLSAIRALEAVMKKINRMPPEEKSKFHLDDTLGGTSTVIHQRAIRRIYGDKSADIIEGLKKNPVVAVPLVLRRLKAKEEEWREAQKNFNKQWREQNEKFYLKSLDHQGITFKQNDVKQLRSKNLLNEIETIYEEYHERAEEGIEVPIGPHMTLCYKSENILNDATNLIIHHMKRQTGIAREDKHKIKLLLRHFISDLFEFLKGEISDDEPEKAETEENSNSTQNKMASSKNCNASNNVSSKSCDLHKQVNSRSNSSSSVTSKKTDDNIDHDSDSIDVGDDSPELRQQFVNGSDCDLKKTHNLFYGNNNWYLFFRLHHILCERLYKIHYASVQLAREEKKAKKDKQSAAAALQIDSKNKVSLEESYLTFISMAKSLLDGNIENTQFEDNLREMFGIHAYVAYTIDKVVQSVVRQLQAIVTDEVSSKFMELYNEFTKDQSLFDCYSTTGCAFSTECAYQKKAEELQSDDNCFKIVAYVDESKLTVELLDAETDPPEDPVESSKWAEYVDGYVTEKMHAPSTRQTRKYYKGLKVFLQRNIRKWQRLAEEHTKVHAKYFSSNNQNMPATERLPSGNDSQHVPPMECVRQKAMENMEISDNTECKFNVNSYKMVFVVHSESYLYKQQGLRKTQQKTRQERLNKFHTWYKSWERRHISGLKTSKSDKDFSIASELSSSCHVP